MRRAVASFVCLLLLPALAGAQTREAPPRRPALAAGADTNSAAAYYSFGVAHLRDNAASSADAFWWAARLDPEAALYPYARWVALLIDDPDLRWTSRRGSDAVAARARAMDSLMIRALIFDPFMQRALDEPLFIQMVAHILGVSINSGQRARERELMLRQAIEQNPEVAAAYHFTRGQYDDALEVWGRVARRSPRNAGIRADRARAFYLLGSLDSARVQMTQALEVARRRDADSMQFSYESKASWEYALGRIQVRLNHPDAAREAFEGALIEDLAYYPAHIHLGLLHIARADTAAALREFVRAVESREDEYLPRVTYAFFLANSGKADSAAAHLRRAIEIEPWAPQPRLMLGAILDGKGDAAGALEAFEGFIVRAPGNDQDLPTVRARVAQLRPAGR